MLDLDSTFKSSPRSVQASLFYNDTPTDSDRERGLRQRQKEGVMVGERKKREIEREREANEWGVRGREREGD